jgi:hypothetical protein
MNFSDYIIDESDYEFFESLPQDEKLLFLYDLICEEAYGPGSMEPVMEVNNLESILREFEDKLYKIVAGSISNSAKANILFINDRVILNSESLEELELAIQDLFLDGYILSEHQLNTRSLTIFHQQRYCKAYNIIGVESKISLN